MAADDGGQPDSVLRAQPARRLDEARRTAAGFLRADPEGFVFVPNATAAVSAVVASVPLGPGDDVLLTDLAYGAVRLAVERACARTGATVSVRPVPLPGGTPGTRWEPSWTG